MVDWKNILFVVCPPNNPGVLVPEDIHIIVFVKSEGIGQRIKDLRENLDYLVLKDHSRIWLGDTTGFNCGDFIAKPIFRPQDYGA
jgi:hypothetical protein